MNRNIKRLIPFAVLMILIAVVYVANLHEYFTLEMLRQEEKSLLSYVKSHPVISVLLYLGVYIASVCIIIPDSMILTLVGGLVFPIPLAITYALLAETIGATAFFWIFQSVFGTTLRWERPFLRKLRRGFHRNEVNYLLFLRVSHVLPFWCTNVAAAYFKVNYWTFIWTCFVGVAPLTVILAYAGHSLSKLFKEHAKLQLSDIFTTEVKIALLALGLATLCPIIYKKIRGNRRWKR